MQHPRKMKNKTTFQFALETVHEHDMSTFECWSFSSDVDRKGKKKKGKKNRNRTSFPFKALLPSLMHVYAKMSFLERV